jgi:hypothetical protein
MPFEYRQVECYPEDVNAVVAPYAERGWRLVQYIPPRPGALTANTRGVAGTVVLEREYGTPAPPPR